MTAPGRTKLDPELPTVLLPLPDKEFDVTEVAVPWRLITDAGHDVVFTTETATVVPQADPGLLTGVLADVRTTCLPKYLERSAYLIAMLA